MVEELIEYEECRVLVWRKTSKLVNRMVGSKIIFTGLSLSHTSIQPDLLNRICKLYVYGHDLHGLHSALF